mmetsp:Transcript_587/g.1101  ORF Transcript_587/g.1101 Transcript_587/m.1101 type:complete len:446 (-) Transcript_587:1136-2473(-)
MDERTIYISFAATAGICSLVSLYWLHQSQKKDDHIPNDAGTIKVDLLSIEKTLAGGGGGDNAMSTLTWFLGDCEKATGMLQKRADLILDANPWLAGRVRKYNGEYTLIYPKVASVDDYFMVKPNLLSREIPLQELGAKLADHLLKTGPTEPLWKVSIYPCSSSTNRFAVVVSMSHVVGDGATFFRIQNMLLNQSNSIESLELTRIHTTEEQQIEALGGKEEYGVLSSTGFIVNCIGGVLRAVWNKKRYGAISRIYLVDKEGMEKVKRDAVAGKSTTPAFVSSNDVLTSWFLQNCNCQHGFMALNFRGRLEGHTDHHAGNYENVIFYRKEDSGSPILIRKSILSDVYKRQVTTDEPMPSFYEMATSTNAICTNWASFSSLCQLEGCEDEIQIPLYNVAALLPSTMAIGLVFRAGPKGLAVFVAGSADKLEGLENPVPFLKHDQIVW